MTDEFDRMFGRGGERPRPTFTDRVISGEAFGGRHDPLQAMAVEAASTTPVPGEYRAFGHLPSGNINLSCEVRWWLEGTSVPEGLAFPYRLLMQVGFTGDDTLRLMLPDTVIEVSGRQLEPLRQAVMRQQVHFIQQFNSKVWSAKPNGETVIDRIEALRP
ncbi:hypothetical protein [Brevundimonas sp.]|uniref:hypothetical protein n=1 Tax=Brevundimonas sp. TaxID=1871086 RepID=UPI003BAAF94D